MAKEKYQSNLFFLCPFGFGHGRLFYKMDTCIIRNRDLKFLYLTQALSSVCVYITGKIYYQDARHEMFALMLIHENWCDSYHKWFVKNKKKAHMHILAEVKSREKD